MDDRYGRRSDEPGFAEARRREAEGRRYRGEGYYGGYYQSGHERERDPDDRGFFDRAGDEVRSWFGDEEAERRRRDDERARRAAWNERERWSGGRPEAYPDDRRWARSWGAVEPDWPDARRGPERGLGERWLGADRERMWPAPRGSGWTDAMGGGEAWTRRGHHTGRGPKGYQRSDTRIQEDVCERLCAHGDIDASEIEVKVLDREVTLLGSVGSRWEKRLAEDAAESVIGVTEVSNQLRVSPSTFGRGADPTQPDWRGRAA